MLVAVRLSRVVQATVVCVCCLLECKQLTNNHTSTNILIVYIYIYIYTHYTIYYIYIYIYSEQLVVDLRGGEGTAD